MGISAGSRMQASPAGAPTRVKRGEWERLAAGALAAACLLVPAARAQQAPPPAPVLPFEGNWTASGTYHLLPMGPGRRAATLHLSGSLVLTAGEGLSRGFGIEAIGFDDGRGNIIGEGVWTDERGDQLFSEMKGGTIRSGHHVTGTITGGTGRYAGLAGEYEFDWQYVVPNPEGGFQVSVVGLKGKVWRSAAGPGEAPR